MIAKSNVGTTSSCSLKLVCSRSEESSWSMRLARLFNNINININMTQCRSAAFASCFLQRLWRFGWLLQGWGSTLFEGKRLNKMDNFRKMILSITKSDTIPVLRDRLPGTGMWNLHLSLNWKECAFIHPHHVHTCKHNGGRTIETPTYKTGSVYHFI